MKMCKEAHTDKGSREKMPNHFYDARNCNNNNDFIKVEFDCCTAPCSKFEPPCDNDESDISGSCNADQALSDVSEEGVRVKVDEPLNNLLAAIKQTTSFRRADSVMTLQKSESSFTSDSCDMADPNQRWVQLLPPATDLSNIIERHVNAVPPMNSGYVFVREMSNVSKVMNLPNSVADFVKQFGISSKFPYRSRVFMCFQATETGLVAFFVVYVQEYGNTCPKPNTNTAYIAMLDSVQLYEPSAYRRLVFYTVLLSYMKYLASTGFEKVFLWSCPPTDGREYVFRCRPKTQRTPTPEVLQVWYDTLMNMGVLSGILEGFNNLFEWCPKDSDNFFRNFPYFFEDHWPQYLSDIIDHVHDNGLVKPATKKRKLNNKQMKTTQVYVNSSSPHTGDKSKVIFERFLSSIEENQKSFLCMILKKSRTFPLDHEFLNYECPSLFVDSRDCMVNFFKENSYAFCDRPNAEISTQALLTKIKSEFTYLVCNCCTRAISNGFSCQKCCFDVCKNCTKHNCVHEHEVSRHFMCRNSDWRVAKHINKTLGHWKWLKASWWLKFRDALSKRNFKAFKILYHIIECEKEVCQVCMRIRDSRYFLRDSSLINIDTADSVPCSDHDYPCEIENILESGWEENGLAILDLIPKCLSSEKRCAIWSHSQIQIQNPRYEWIL